RNHAPEMMQGRSDANALRAEPELANGVFMGALAMLDYRHGTLHGTVEFKKTKHDQCVRQVTDIHRRLHGRADQAVLCHGENGYYALRGKVAQKLMHLRHEK